jgi:hypothetical protein
MNQTRRRSVQMVRRYIRDGSLFRVKARGSLDCEMTSGSRQEDSCPRGDAVKRLAFAVLGRKCVIIKGLGSIL